MWAVYVVSGYLEGLMKISATLTLFIYKKYRKRPTKILHRFNVCFQLHVATEQQTLGRD